MSQMKQTPIEGEEENDEDEEEHTEAKNIIIATEVDALRRNRSWDLMPEG